ncbi:bacillithiol biosynthesis cysteine-adding enzyme BshC [Bizionia argentinensis JUB59]|uniref:Putative cysteine ligase BshC n=1 Tax=Bizionia argentinensis JUB59 TaxID=1046627 RepID=G2EE50_9FLAO|nr:bacillithiol biosynthesis cysteine-adding enzyme BshC [Bizionia argentinensis]EGV43258.1 bacillithiol biosynthesis cysteine-adding enzyme BshC [Bizionia argentinensis JUB59]
MPTDCITFRNTNYFSGLICDYLDEKSALKPFYHRFPKLDNFKDQIDEKKASFTSKSRAVLVSSLQEQYQNVNSSSVTKRNIESLKDDNTFTITTGHQLNIFTGPLYFLYKIVSTINLCEELKVKHPETNFVPIYWMATEDHDFEEINYFNFKEKKVQWNREASGPVGELDLEGFKNVFEVFSKQLPKSINGDKLVALFQNTYVNHNNLTEATRYLVNELFSEYGLVILDGNDKALKKEFIPYVKEELVNQSSFKNVSETNEQLNSLPENYKIQVNPREINLFYIKPGLRERIVEENGVYQVLETDISWNKSQLLDEVESHPERFSPNVILRPLFQEVVLPNLCYIGGGGELAYWFQLKSNFESQKIPFPILLLRNSVLLTTSKQQNKLEKLGLKNEDLFLKQNELLTKVTKDISEIQIDLSKQKKHLQKQFEDLYILAQKTDESFKGAVSAQEHKQIKGLEHLEKRLLKAQKRKQADVLERVKLLQDDLFPNQSLQERQTNFSTFYLEFGDQLIQQLMLNLQPLKNEFIILNLE